jgi:serpin B
MISSVRQKAYVDVNEEGTEAAAATSVGMVLTSAPVRTTVRVDRPFIFAIRERLSGTVLFLATVNRLPGN